MYIEKIEYEGMTIEIHQDESPDDPRNWDNVGTMVCFHNRYNLGDKKHGYNSEDYSSWNEIENAIMKNNPGAYILPIFMMDHSGLTLRTHGFSDVDPMRWDWGQIGFIFCSRKKARHERGVKRMSKKEEEKIYSLMEGEIEIYNQYINGEIYGYIIKDKNDDIVDSCWGYYGDDKEYMIEDAKKMIDQYNKHRKAEDAARRQPSLFEIF